MMVVVVLSLLCISSVDLADLFSFFHECTGMRYCFPLFYYYSSKYHCNRYFQNKENNDVIIHDFTETSRIIFFTTDI